MTNVTRGTARTYPYPVSAMWDYVSDLRHHPEWLHGWTQAALEGDEPIGVGSRFTGSMEERGQTHAVSVVVREWEPQRRLVYEDTDGPTPYVSEFVFRSRGEGSTELAYTVTLDVRDWLMKVFFTVLRPLGMWIADQRLNQEMDKIGAGTARSVSDG